MHQNRFKILSPTFALFLSALLMCCGAQDPDAAFNRERSPLKLQKRDVSGLESYKILQDYTVASDLFEIVDFVALETSGGSLISDIGDILLYQGDWIIIDRIQGRVLRFNFEGKFLGLVGGTGQGPGEYISPSSLAEWRGQLVVADSGSSELLFYDEKSRFIRSIASRNHGFTVPRLNLFSEDAWFVINYRAHSPEAPNHLKIDLDDRSWKIAAGFGERFQFMEKADVRKRIRQLSWESGARVGDKLWLGSPYKSTLDIYDLEGRFVGHIGSGFPESLSEVDLSGVKDIDRFNEIMANSCANYHVFHMGQLVVASYSRLGGPGSGRVNVFDEEGNLLKTLKEARHINHIPRWYTGNFLVSYRPAFISPDSWQKGTRPEEWETLVDKGFRPESISDEDNPIMFLSVLRPGLSH